MTTSGAVAGRTRRGPAHDDPRLDIWRAFLFAQSALMPALDANLRAEAGLTLAEFDTLLNLSFARGRRLRMSELADRVLLSRSGVTRMVDRLEHAGHVRREACAPDGRGAYAVLTREGAARIREALPIHLANVEARFLAHIDAADGAAVSRALGDVADANGRPVPATDVSSAAFDRATEASPEAS